MAENKKRFRIEFTVDAEGWSDKFIKDSAIQELTCMVPYPEDITFSEVSNPWHTGTPTEEGFWLVKYKCVVEGKYNGRLTYRAVKIEKDKIDGFAYESGGIGAEEYWKPIEYQKIDDLWRGEE